MALEPAYILLVVGGTSLGIVIFGSKCLGFTRAQLWLGMSKACEVVGLTLVFFVLNLGLGMLPILLARSLMGRFISIYVLSDSSLLILSLLQALVFQGWWQCARHARTPASSNVTAGREGP
jgi:hypothetical protein